jgi:prepilin-type N-terminal cleavage/methylation domain-containing protein
MKQPRHNSGFSIVEIVIAVMIIGILATILIPVLITKAEKAKVAAANRDLEELANAEERVAIDIGHYVRLYVLDDVRDSDQPLPIGLGAANDRMDGIVEEPRNTIYQNPWQIFITLDSNVLLDAGDAQTLLAKIAYATTESPYKWDGPYLNIHRDEPMPPVVPNPFPPPLPDTPTDPWGNDYLLFTRQGLVVEPDGTINAKASIAGAASANMQVFDRPTVLSLGPDGLPGSPSKNESFGKGDDVRRSFGY